MITFIQVILAIMQLYLLLLLISSQEHTLEKTISALLVTAVQMLIHVKL